jgi:type I restriction enzyme R subunit
MIINTSESGTRVNFIGPKLVDNHWESIHIIRAYYFTDGRKLLSNKRGKRLFLDYLLKFNNTNLAIIEAKKLGDHPTKGLKQAIGYAEKLKSNFVYAINDGIFRNFYKGKFSDVWSFKKEESIGWNPNKNSISYEY